MGKEGEKLCRKVNEGTATASELGMKTTDQTADGISLMTLASCPEDHHVLVKPTKMH